MERKKPNNCINLVHEINEFIARFEEAETKLAEWQHSINETLLASQQHVNSQLEDIQETTHQLQSFMSEAGVTHWQTSTENILKQGQEHVEMLKQEGQKTIKKHRKK